MVFSVLFPTTGEFVKAARQFGGVEGGRARVVCVFDSKRQNDDGVVIRFVFSRVA